MRSQEALKSFPININPPKIITKQGYPIVVFKRNDFLVRLAEKHKFTLTGKFIYTMPKMEVISNEFFLPTKLSGSVKLTHVNLRHLYIDLDNEYYNTII